MTGLIISILTLILCLCARGIHPTLGLSHHAVIKLPYINLDFVPQWLMEILILIPSTISLGILLATTGGISSPFNVYLGTFPIVISVLSSSRIFVVLTVLLTYTVYILNWWLVKSIVPIPGHETHVGMLSLITYAVSLGVTAMLVAGDIKREPDEDH